MAYGVQVKATITSADVNAEELRKAVQGALDDAIKANPIVVKSFTAKINNRTVTHLRSSIQQAIDTGTSQKPIQIKNFSAKLTAKERNAIVKQMRADLDAGGLVVKIQRIDASNAVTNLRKQLTTMLSGLSIGGLKEFLGDTASSEALERNAKAAEKLAEATENVKKKTEAANVALQRLSTLRNKVNSINTSLFGMTDADARSGYQSQVVAILGDIEKAKDASSDAQEEMIAKIQDSVQALHDEASAHLNSQKAAERKAAAVERSGGAEAVAAAEAAKAARQQEAAQHKQNSTLSQTAQLQSRIKKWTDANTKAYSQNKVVIDGMLKELGSEAGVSAQRLDEIRKEFNKIDAAATVAGNKGTTFFEKLKAGWQKFGGWTIVTKSMMLAVNQVRNMVRAVTELDAAMTELRKVTNLTAQQYDSFLTDATAMAKDVGATIADSVNAVADFSRLGFNLDEAKALAEAALVYKNVGDGIEDISTATESLISTIKAFEDFGYAAEDSMFIIDKFNEVGNNFSISSSGIGEALRRSASALAAAGNDLDQSIGLITGMNTVVQDPDVVGTALKTVSMYLRAAKTDAEEAGIETEGMANSVAELRKELLALTGVDIMLDANTFKSTFEIMRELSEVWGKLTDVSQANVLELIGGKRNGNVITSLLDNFDDAIGAMEASQKAMGSATAENEKYLDSINGKLAEMKSSFEAMSNAFIDNDLVKFLLDVATAIMNIVTALQEVNVLIPLIVAGFTAFSGIKLAHSMSTLPGIIEDLIGKGKTGIEIAESIGSVVFGMNQKQKELLKTLLLTEGVVPGLNLELGKTIVENLKLSGAAGEATLSFKNLGASMKAAFSGINKWILASTAILSVALGLYDLHNKAVQEAIEKADELQQTYAESNSTYQENVKTLESLRDRFEELSTGVGDNGENVSLTKSEYDEYLRIVEQIADISPSIVKSYDDESIALKDYKGVIDQAIEAQKELRAEAEKTYLASGDTLFKGNKHKFNDAEEALMDSGYNVGVALDYGSNQYAYNKALESIGIMPEYEYQDYVDWVALTADDYERIYENSRAFMAALESTGAYTKDQLHLIQNAINNMGSSYSSMMSIREQEAQFLIDKMLEEGNYLTDSMENIPVAAYDEFRDGLTSVVDPTKSYTHNIQEATKYSNEFARILSSDTGIALSDMAVQLASGEGNLVKFNALLGTFGTQFKDNPAFEAAYEYFSGLSDGIKKADEDAESLNTTVIGLSDVLKNATKAQDILADAEKEMSSGSGLSNETIQAIQDALGEQEKLSDYLLYENGVVKLNTEAWENRTRSMFSSDMTGLQNQNTLLQRQNDELDKSIEKAQQFIDKTEGYDVDLYKNEDEARAAIKGFEDQQAANRKAIEDNTALYEIYAYVMNNIGVEAVDVTKKMSALTDVIDTVQSASSLIANTQKEVADSGKISEDSIKSLIALLGDEAANWEEYVTKQGNGYVLNEEKLRAYIESQIDGVEATETLRNMLISLMDVDTSGNPFDKMTEAIDKATKAASLLQSAREDMKKNGILSADTITSGRELFGKEFEKYFTSSGDGYKLTTDNEEAIRSFGSEALSANNVVGALYATIMQLFNDTPDTTKIERLTKSLSNISNASSLISTINQEVADSGSNSLDTLASFIEMYGEGWQAHVDFSNGIKISTDAIKDLSDEWINNMGITDDAKVQLIAQRDAAIETAKANNDLADSYSNIKSAASLGGEYGNDAELTYDAYQQLIAADNRYAYALEFQNGVLTINQEKHVQITETILAETAAKALEEAQTLALDSRYIELTSRIGELNDEEQKELDTRNAQIMGLTVYANELNNANSALNRFLNSAERANTIGYDGAADALQTIKDVLTNKKSDMYGMVGHDKFQSAVKLLISPEIEIGSAEYKRQMKTLERYITEDGKGMSNLYSDMLSKGIIDETTGAVNMSLEEMANTLGLTVSAMQLLIDQFNLYQDEGNKLKVDYDNTGATDAQADLEGTKTAAENAQTPLQQVAATIGEIKSGYEAITASPLDIDVSSRTTSALETTYNTLGSILKKLQAIQDIGTITTTVAVNQTGSSGGFVSNLIGGVINKLTGNSSAGGTDRAVGGKTLVGELGREAVVDPENNRWYTVGDNGPEFVNLPKNAIVFNAKQTEELLRAGRTRTTGESMASGNAAASLFSNIINTAKSVANSIKNGIVNAVKKVSSDSDVDAISGAAPKATSSGLKVSGTPTKPSTGSGKSSSGGSGSSKKDAEDELTVLEKIQKKYEEINAQTEHLIEHQEHFYKVSENGLDFDGMGSSLAAQVQLYQKMMADAQAGIAELRAEGASDTDEELQEMERVYWDAYDSMHDLLDEINELYVNGLNDKIDGIQGAFATLQDAASELSNDGAISVDTFQKLLDNGINYMSLLEKTGDQYTINEDKVRALLAAEKEQLAVENALAYVNQLKQALTDQDADLTQNLINLTNEIGDSTWAAVYAQAALLKNLGLTDDQYQAIIDNIDAMREISGKVADDLSTDTSELFKEQKTAIDYILKKTEELIKFETEQQIDAIEDQIDAYKEIINLKKESLQKSREEEEYQKSVSEKTQEIARIQAKLGQLSLDDSREAEAQRAEYMEKLKELQEDLGNLQTDRSDEMTQEMLDKQLEDYENSKKEEIERLEEQISSTEKIYQLAIERLSNGWDSIYQEIITWNTNVGNTLNEEITENWNIALAAAQKYGSYIAALNAMDGSGKVSLSGDGLPKYHSGGIVDDRGSINDKEVLAVLKKGELVADEPAKNAIFEAVDFVDALSKRLKTKIGNIASGAGRSIYHAADKLMSGGSLSALSASGANGMVFSPTITVAIQHSGTMTDSDADRYGRRIADTALDTLYNRFKTSGIGSTSNIRLRT